MAAAPTETEFATPYKPCISPDETPYIFVPQYNKKTETTTWLCFYGTEGGEADGEREKKLVEVIRDVVPDDPIECRVVRSAVVAYVSMSAKLFGAELDANGAPASATFTATMLRFASKLAGDGPVDLGPARKWLMGTIGVHKDVVSTFIAWKWELPMVMVRKLGLPVVSGKQLVDAIMLDIEAREGTGSNMRVLFSDLVASMFASQAGMDVGTRMQGALGIASCAFADAATDGILSAINENEAEAEKLKAKTDAAALADAEAASQRARDELMNA